MNQKNAKTVSKTVGAISNRPHIVGKTQKGITLIALVITIIVLLILAGVTISMVLGDDGIISNAQQAKKQNEDASLKDAISVAKADAATYKYVEQTAMEEDKLEENGFTFPADYEYPNSVAKVVEGVPIPIGFAYVQGTKVDTGLIVVDGYGNEYVWVPVDGTKVQLELDSNYYGSFMGEDGNAECVDLALMGNITAEEYEKEYTDMVASVEIYGGFYVGRYETSWTGSRVASVANVEPINGDSPIDTIKIWSDEENTLIDGLGSNWYTFYNKQKELYNKESSSVVSGMIYGSQWDAIMDWMSDVPNVIDSSKLYINDPTEMGNFNSSPIKTGSNSAYNVKNIFDLAGNCSEWSQERPDNTVAIFRSGSWGSAATPSPVSFRYYLNSAIGEGSISTRLQLYIK